MLRDPIARLATAINSQRKNEGLKLAEEKRRQTRKRASTRLSAVLKSRCRLLWKPGGFEWGGNTKTHGIVRGEFIVHENLPSRISPWDLCEAPHLPRMSPLFGVPGPTLLPILTMLGFMSISIKLMGVPGPS